MTAPQATPLLLVSAYNTAVNQAEPATLLDHIVIWSAFLQRVCKRRFDEYIATHKHTARRVIKGGNLLNQFTLLLKDDCRAVTAFYYDVPVGGPITSGVAIASGYQLIDNDPVDGQQTTSARELALDIYGSYTLEIPSVDPRNSIWVTGRWGFGGQWVSNTTLNGALNDTATSVPVTSGSGLEAGMLLKVDSEYLYLESVSSNTLTVTRGYNGSTAASHLTLAAVSYWQPDPLVQSLIRRLCQWSMKQIEAPMAGSVTVGDFQFPVDTSGLPKDLYLLIEQSGLKAPQSWIIKA